MQTLLEKHWHRMESKEVARLFDVDPDKGLDILEAERRLQHFGENVISGKKPQSAIKRFLLQFHCSADFIFRYCQIVTFINSTFLVSPQCFQHFFRTGP